MAATASSVRGVQLLERVDRGVEGAQLRRSAPSMWPSSRSRAGPSGSRPPRPPRARAWSSWSRSSYSLLRATASCAACEQEVGHLGQGRGDHHRLAGLVLLDQPRHAVQPVVGPDGAGVELHHDHAEPPFVEGRRGPSDRFSYGGPGKSNRGARPAIRRSRRAAAGGRRPARPAPRGPSPASRGRTRPGRRPRAHSRGRARHHLLRAEKARGPRLPHLLERLAEQVAEGLAVAEARARQHVAGRADVQEAVGRRAAAVAEALGHGVEEAQRQRRVPDELDAAARPHAPARARRGRRPRSSGPGAWRRCRPSRTGSRGSS